MVSAAGRPGEPRLLPLTQTDVPDVDHPRRGDLAVGLLWPWLGRLGLGRLPGDIIIERDNFSLYLPIATGILISVLLSLILWLLSR